MSGFPKTRLGNAKGAWGSSPSRGTRPTSTVGFMLPRRRGKRRLVGSRRDMGVVPEKGTLKQRQSHMSTISGELNSEGVA